MDKYAIMAEAGFTRAPYDTPYGVERVAEVAATRIAELEKENAALKARLETLRKYAESDVIGGSYIPLDDYEPAKALYDDAPPTTESEG